MDGVTIGGGRGGTSRGGRRARPWAALVVIGLAGGIAACGADPDAEEGGGPLTGGEEIAPAASIEVGGVVDPDSPIADVELVRSPDVGPAYANARIGIAEPAAGARFDEGEPVEVHFSLSGFEVSVPTPDGDTRGVARADGQHIHFIVNDRTYQALYDDEAPYVVEDLPAGTHVLRAFPGRDWHESVKTPGALAQRLIVVGEAEPDYGSPEEWGPTLIYSRPQGDYMGADADSILVDFVVANVQLGQDDHRVRLTLNDSREFVVSEWAPYLLVGLPEGEHTLRLELLAPDGSTAQAPFHPIERRIRVGR